MARPSKFSEALAEKMLDLYKKGKTDAQVAEIIGVTDRTINNWKVSKPQFLQALRESKGIADDLVVASLFSRAVGYSHMEEKVFCNQQGDVTRVLVKKHYPPDTTAMIFWLKNRQPDLWREPSQSSPETITVSPAPTKTFTQFCVDAGYFEPYPKQEEMRAFGLEQTDPRLLLGARGYGKTDFITIMGEAYDIYLAYVNGKDMSEHTTLIITKSKSRNTAICEEISVALIKNGIPLDKSNASTIRVRGLIGQDHSVEAITIKTSMRGRHPKRIIMDDPVTDEDVSEAMRATVKRRYDEAYKLCSNILIIGQPAHHDDLYANLRGIIKTMQVPYGSIPELDVDLAAMKIAGVDPISIEMSYHLRVPKDGSSIFSNIKYMEQYPVHGDSVAFLDPADGGDTSALTVMRGFMDGVAVHGKVWKKAWYHCLDELVEVLVAKNVKRLCFETNKHGMQPIEQLQSLLAQYGIGVQGLHSETNKHATIQAAGSYAHMIHLSKDSDKAYTDQVIKYEYNAKNDDAPDSMARCLQWIGLLRGRK